MSNKQSRSVLVHAVLAWLLAGCGPSQAELQLHDQVKTLQHDLQEQAQYNADLKVRMQLAHARNNVLIDLVHGLTTDPEHPQTSEDPSATLAPAHSSLQKLDRDLEALVTSVQHSKQDMDAVREQRKSLQDELARARKIIEDDRAVEAKAQARLDAFRSLLGQLTSMIEHGELDVRVVRNRMVLQLPDSVLFASNDARVLPSGKLLLDRVAAVLKSVERREFEIAGHTDSLPIRYGPFRSNWELSAARALGVMLYLQKQGVPAERLSASAHADTQPIADEATPTGRQKNRRIEIVLLPNLEELPDLSTLSALQTPPAPAAEPSPSSTNTSTSPPTGAGATPTKMDAPAAAELPGPGLAAHHVAEAKPESDSATTLAPTAADTPAGAPALGPPRSADDVGGHPP